ncbi:LysR family transcriptional regulator [Streptomyces sp. NPDC003077]|uniref:LysR family transcriptional regulator n=1 Tax=Streptomyces sp. NPDC003077 TaxID=3154443 RepID=UPI0033B90395
MNAFRDGHEDLTLDALLSAATAPTTDPAADPTTDLFPDPATGPATVSDDALRVLDTVELRHLRAFVTVAEERSFTHAADRLYVGQPTLTRTIRALERTLGTRLLDRTTRRVEPTEAGQRLYDALAPLLGRLADALRAPGVPPVLRLGFTSLLPDACGRISTEFEAATGSGVRLVRRDTPLAGLESGAADVAVLRGEAPPGARVRTRVLLYEPRVAVVARAETSETAGRGPATATAHHGRGTARAHHGRGSTPASAPTGPHPAARALRAIARRRVLDWAELADLPLVVNTVTGTTRPDLWPEGRRPRPVCTADNFDEWLEAVAAGHGVGVAPEPVAQRHTHPGLRFLRLKNAPPVPVRLAIPARGAHPLAERFFRLAGPEPSPDAWAPGRL